MKSCKRILAVLLTFLLLFSALPLTVSAAEAEEQVQAGQYYRVTYTLTSPLEVLNAQISVSYSDNLELVYDLSAGSTDILRAFPVIGSKVVVNHKEDSRKIDFAVTSADAPYKEFTAEGGAVVYDLLFVATKSGKASITPSIEYIGGESASAQDPAGIPIIENNAKKADGVTDSLVSETTAAPGQTVINGDIYANQNEIVYYEYLLDTDLSLVDAEIYINYTAGILEIVDQKDEIRFPNLTGYEALNLNSKDNSEKGIFSMNFSDIYDDITGFSGGKILIVLAFRVVGEGDATIEANTVWIGGRNTSISKEEIEIGSEAISDKIYVTSELRKEFTVTLPEGEGFTAKGADTVLEGNNYTFTITAEEGYDLSNITVSANGTAIKGKDGVYTVENVSADLVITVTGVEKIKINVTLPTGTGYTASGAATVKYGEDYTFTVTAAEGYDPASIVVKVNGKIVTPDNNGNYVIKGVTESPKIEITGAALYEYNVKIPTGEGFKVNGNAKATYGEDYTFTVDISDGYNADNMTVTVNGEIVTPDENGNYTVKNVTGPVTIEVTGVEKDVPPAPKGLLGDVDSNGKIDSADATLVLQYFAHIIDENTEGYDHSVSDVDGSRATDSSDATLILQYFARIITKFPAEG